MKHYHKSIEINASFHKVWEYLADIKNFGRFNDYHHGVEFLTEQKQGTGTQFKTQHTFWPIFPIFPLETICTISGWEKTDFNAKIVIEEQPSLMLPFVGRKAVPLTAHTQIHSLNHKNIKIILYHYEVSYEGVPSSMPSWYHYVNRKVEKVMEDELKEIKYFLESQRNRNNKKKKDQKKGKNIL